MSYYVARLKRPYDYRSLIEAYIYTQREDFLHPDFTAYYSSLLNALERVFGIRISHEGLAAREKAFLMLFRSTVRSLLQISSPWDGYLDATLIHKKLDECDEVGPAVYTASAAIDEANRISDAAHHRILDVLFRAIFGECDRVVTSEELLAAGFDDSREPNSADYYDSL